MAKNEDLKPEVGFDQAKMYVWLKGLEGKVNNLNREINVLKNDLSRKNSQLKQEMKTFSEDALELKREQTQALQKIDLIIGELKRTAGVEEVATIKKYIDFWNPLNFVTQRDLERMVDRKVQSLQMNKESENNARHK